MEFTEKTKLNDILAEYPYLENVLLQDAKIAALASSPIAKRMMKHATLKDASLFSGVPVQELIRELKRITGQA